MPEGPEITLTSDILNTTLRNKFIITVEVFHSKYSNMTTLNGKQILQIKSIGKMIWFDYNKDHYLVTGCGLTGFWAIRSGIDKDLQYVKFKIHYSDGIIYYCDKLNYGFVKRVTNNELNKKIKVLMPDLLKENFDIYKLKTCKKKIVAALLDQTIIGSGIGNYLVCEILYKSCISPHRICNTLTSVELDFLRYNIKYLLKLAYLYPAMEYLQFIGVNIALWPRHNYHSDIHINESKFTLHVYQRVGDYQNNVVTVEKIVPGRKTYWVKNLQH